MSPAAVSSLTPEGVGTWYVQIVEQAAPQLIAGLRATASASGAALFHCAAGKDRTGVFTAAVLSVLGAEDDVIIEDYARTDPVMPAIMRRISPMMQAVVREHDAPRLDPAAGGALFAAPAETMATMLRVMRREHGSILDLLRDRGLDTATITSLRERVVH
jgi:protein tyrosine/serine phosphatase